MANIVYNGFKKRVVDGTIDLDSGSAVIRCMLERSTSTYSPNVDHVFLDSFTGGGGVEISVASYARQTVANKAVNQDDANDRAEWDFDDVSFGSLEAGQTVKAIIFYVQVGGDDSTPANDILICRIDTDANNVLPAALGGGVFSVQVNAEGMIQFV